MSRLIVVSNRLPVSMTRKGKEITFQPSVGGVATGLSSTQKTFKTLWIGWPGIPREKAKGKEKAITSQLEAEGCYPVFLSQYEMDNYYHGFANKIIWPLFHYFTQYPEYDKSYWKVYKRVNELFCERVLEAYKPGDVLWIHDYHLMLLPQLIREKVPDATIGFFLHIPFPSFEVFRLLPWRREIAEGLMGADLIGFHTYDYVRHFLSTVRRLLGYEHSMNQITARSCVVRVDAFPMGIDYERFASAAQDPEVEREAERIRKRTGDQRVILSIDRLDYTKGIPERLEAFDTFLDSNPEYKGKVTLIMVAVPSRAKVEHYRILKNQVDELVGYINGRHGTIDWIPIWYMYRFLPFQNLVPIYSVADVALITPIRDGMNLIAKEFIATKGEGKGVLILSEMAGAATELGEALIVNPRSREEVAESIKEALTMPVEEQKERNRAMQRRLRKYNVISWSSDFLDSLERVKEIQKEFCGSILIERKQQDLIKRFSKSKRRLLLLDYDGTLVPFSKRPDKAVPDKEILQRLRKLGKNESNEIVIISGRDRKTVEKWFGELGIGLVAEHGVWIKEKGKRWRLIEPMRNEWKKQVYPMLEFYADRTPRSFVEDKEYSLVWHYRRTDPELGQLRARELKDALLSLTENLNLEVLEGNKIVEIKNVGINKGRAASFWLKQRRWDFILAIGDDWTDEFTFEALPERAYSIKVGLGVSKARFNTPSYEEVRELLKELGSE